MPYRPNQNLLAIAIVLAVSITVVVHLTVLPLYEVNPGPAVVRKLIGEYEQSLCSTSLRPLRARWRRHCPRDGIVTVAQGGRLGNQMWEYASVWAVARRTGLEPFVPRCLRRVLDDVFVDLNIPGMSHIAHCPAHWQDAVKSPELWGRTNQTIVLPRFVILPELVLTWVDDIRNEYRFKKKFITTAANILRDAAGDRRNVTFVGVHVRRTDYIFYLWRTRHAPVADVDFFTRAMNYFRQKYQSVLFVVVSDDATWCRMHLTGAGKEDVFVASEPGVTGAAQDLAVMAACNHSIIDYGTFGVWGAILAGGETLVYNISHHSSVRVAELLPDWQVFS